jgi:hypothetical protein
LDDPQTIGYTLKCFGCGLVGLRSDLSFEHTMQLVAREAGDADTNGAVCGAMMGVRLGYRALPLEWLRALPNKQWLDRKIVAFLGVAGLISADTAAAAEALYQKRDGPAPVPVEPVAGPTMTTKADDKKDCVIA